MFGQVLGEMISVDKVLPETIAFELDWIFFVVMSGRVFAGMNNVGKMFEETIACYFDWIVSFPMVGGE